MHVRHLTRARARSVAYLQMTFTYSDAFRKVISHVGSFTNIRGAHNLQYLVRTTERKPLTVFLQSGSHDFGERNSHEPADALLPHTAAHADQSRCTV